MIEEPGRVVAVESGFAWVETQRRSACDGCEARSGCGTSALARYVGRRSGRVRVIDPLPSRVGDTVVVALREDALLRGSLAVYLLPLLLMLGGALLGQTLSEGAQAAGEAMPLLGGALGLGAGFAWVARFSRRLRRDPRYHPIILRRA